MVMRTMTTGTAWITTATLLVAASIAACGSGDGTPADDGAVAGSGSGGTGGSGGTSGPDDLLPNLSSNGGSGGTSAETPPANDCSFLELDTCVRAAVAEAVDCAHADITGTFATDRRSCALDGAGGEVRFDEPFPSGYNGFHLAFELLIGGETCLRYSDAVVSDAPAPLEMQTRSHLVRWSPGYERTLECDGVSKTFTVADVTACEGGSLQSPEIFKDVGVTGAADTYIYREGGMTYVFRCE
jgi:hypothetical protein